MSAAPVTPAPSSLLLRLALGLLVALYVVWFRDDPMAVAFFALPPLLLLAGVLLGRRTAAFWSGVVALAWFSHGVMIAYAEPSQRTFALLAVALSVVIVVTASLPGLRARFGRKPAA